MNDVLAGASDNITGEVGPATRHESVNHWGSSSAGGLSLVWTVLIP